MGSTDPILSIVRRARRRIGLQSVLSRFAVAALWVGASLLILVCASKGLAAWWPDLGARGWWFPVLLGLAFAGLALALVLTRGRRPSDVAVASLVDVQLKLHDRLSTAMAVAGRQDPFAAAAIEDGVRLASDRRLTESLGRAMPVRWPKNGWIGPLLCVLAVAVWWFVPGLSPAAVQAAPVSDPELAAAESAAQMQIEAVQQQIEQSPELSKELGDIAPQQGASNDPTNDRKTPDEIHRETARRMTELSQKLDDVLSSERTQSLSAMRDALSKIEPGKSPEVKALAEALKIGDAAAASEAMQEVMEQIASGKMDEATREQMAADLERLAQQIADAADSNEALREALESAGMDGELASNMEAVEAALAASKSLNAEQKERLRKAIKSQKSANAKLRKLSESCKKSCSQCKNGGSKSKDGTPSSDSEDADSEAGEQAEGVLSEMEADAELESAAKSLRSQCRSGQCQGSRPGPESRKSGTGREGGTKGGAIGEGDGGDGTDAVAAEVAGKKSQMGSKRKAVIARQLVDAPPLVGESRARLREIAGDIERGYEEGTDDDPVPPHLRDLHKHYFGDLKQRIDAKSAGGAAGGSGGSGGGSPPTSPNVDSTGKQSSDKAPSAGSKP